MVVPFICLHELLFNLCLFVCWLIFHDYFCLISDFFKINFYKKIVQEHYQIVKQLGSRSGRKFCQAWSGSKLFAKITKFATSRQSSKSKVPKRGVEIAKFDACPGTSKMSFCAKKILLAPMNKNTHTNLISAQHKLSFHGFSFFFQDWWAEVTHGAKNGGHFLKWWAQVYQTNHSWHLGCILYLHTDTDTCMHICILTADYTVKPVLSGHSKKDQLLFNAGQTYCRMLQGEHSAILSTFIKLPFVIIIFVLSFWVAA